MSNTIYPKGISFFAPRDKAPEWVKGSIIITPNELFKWLKENESLLTNNEKYGKQITLQLTDNGLRVDTYKPKEVTAQSVAATNTKEEETELPF